MITGSGRPAAKWTPFKWVNTCLGSIKTALVGTYRHVTRSTRSATSPDSPTASTAAIGLAASSSASPGPPNRTAPHPYHAIIADA